MLRTQLQSNRHWLRSRRHTLCESECPGRILVLRLDQQQVILASRNNPLSIFKLKRQLKPSVVSIPMIASPSPGSIVLARVLNLL